MTASSGHISNEELAAIGGKLKRKLKPKNPLDVPFHKDLLFTLAHLAFLPLSYFTLMPGGFELQLGFTPGLMIQAALWVTLIASMLSMIYVTKSGEIGNLTRYSIIFLILAFAISIPITLGFTAMTVVTFSVGGFEVLMYLWKGIFFFGFLWYWFNLGAKS